MLIFFKCSFTLKRTRYSAVLGEEELKPNSYTVYTVLTLSALLVVWPVGMSTLAIESNEIRVPEDHPRIQEAIEAANPGDVIQVAAGTYSENLIITKPLKLIGEGSDQTFIAENKTVIRVEADNVEITGFSVQNGTYGIFLWNSNNVLLRNNDMSNNTWNFGVWGDSISHFVHDIDSSNTVDGKPMYFWVNQHGKQVPNDAGYVALVNSTNIVVEDIGLTSNEQGILLVSTNNSVIDNVSISGNDEGIDLRWSHNNTIKRSRLSSINWRAIFLQDSHNNTFYENKILDSTYGVSTLSSDGNIFYHNNLIDNKDQVYDFSQNIWNSEAQEGNYWSDYNGTDTDGDGVGDTYLPWQGVDWYPLIDPWGPLIYVDPSIVTANTGEFFTIRIRIQDVTNLFSYEVKLGFDNDTLKAVDVVEGPFIKDGTTSPSGTFFTFQMKGTYIIVDCITLGRYPGVSGSGTLFTANFTVKDARNSTLHLYDTILLDYTLPEPNMIPHTTSNGTFYKTVPTVQFTYSPLYPVVGETVTFNASSIHDPYGNIVSYEWDFGDGSNGTGVTATHIYYETGNYTTTLTVVYSSGSSTIDTSSITVGESSLPSSWWIPVVGLGVIITIIVSYWIYKSSRKSKVDSSRSPEEQKSDKYAPLRATKD